MGNLENKNTIAQAKAGNRFMNMSMEELLAFKRDNPQIFQQQGGPMETLRGVGDIWSGGKSFTFDPKTGRPYAVDTGVKKETGGGINELIAIEKFKLQKQLQEEGAEERKIKREKAALELEEKKKGIERQEVLRKEFEAQQSMQPTPTEVTEPSPAPMATPTTLPTPTLAAIPIATPAPTQILPTGDREAAKLPPKQIVTQDEKGIYKRIDNPLYETTIKARNAINQELEKQKGKELAEKYGQAARVVGMMRILNQQYKRVDEEFPAGTGALARFTHDIASFRFAPKALQKKAESLFPAVAQKQETKIADVPILSGQARYVRDLARAIEATIPDISRIKDVRDNLIAQSVRNMMTLVYGVQNGFLGADNLRKLGIEPDSVMKDDKEAQALLDAVQVTPEQEQAIEEAISYVLEAPAIEAFKPKATTEKKLPKGFSSDEWERIE
jgi:hypothetical protein